MISTIPAFLVTWLVPLKPVDNITTDEKS
jgi:hypothetical protein